MEIGIDTLSKLTVKVLKPECNLSYDMKLHRGCLVEHDLVPNNPKKLLVYRKFGTQSSSLS